MPKTVLLVEDDPRNQRLFNDLLEIQGYRTVTSDTGLDAVELARAHRPDLILMDIRLPQVSGVELTKIIKADDELRRIPVVALTAKALPGDEARLLAGGCDGYLAKPINIKDFLSTVAAYVEAGDTPPARPH
ncbi:MAG: response regulator [Magnetovibrio sp.]|nr:response regulator [Magnetovibrio sp.]